MFADLDAGNIGRDRLEFTSKFSGCVGLEIPGVNGAAASVEEDKDEGNILRRATRLSGSSLPCKHVGQGETETKQARGADAQKITPLDAIAVTALSPHGIAPANVCSAISD